MNTESITLSIIVVAFNEGDHVARLKQSFDNLRLPAGVVLQSILVDGGSEDHTVEAARNAGFTTIEVLPGASIPVCRNKGHEVATGQWIAHIDGDCELAENWLEVAEPFLQSSDPVVLGWPVSPPEPGTWVERAWHTHWTHKNLVLQEFEGQQVVIKEAFRLLTTRNLVMNRAIAETIDGFNEELPTGEDTDFVFRAYQRDLHVLAVPGLKVVHYGEPKTLGEFYKQQLWHANRSSYTTIMRESKGQTGGNAPKFTFLYLVTALLFIGALSAFAISGCPWYLLALLPWPGLISLPAAMIAFKAKKPLRFFPLCALYAAYGLARTLDFVGLFRKKSSWKS